MGVVLLAQYITGGSSLLHFTTCIKKKKKKKKKKKIEFKNLSLKQFFPILLHLDLSLLKKHLQ